ncbi:MAG: FAD-binding oxidoreductase [Alphaproteobacteria bacterium]|nr:FAD-binding oxidoreductase [Alphaproteobacteria bacterium]
MSYLGFASEAQKKHYDVVIIGGAMVGSSVAWFTSDNPDFDGSILVIERDPSYEFTSTAHTNSCIRQQFSNEINIKISQFGAEFIKNFRSFMHDDPEVPEITLQNFGYLYLADNQQFADILIENQKLQTSLGAGTRIMTADEIAAEYPFYQLDDIILGSINTKDEGYFDGNSLFDWWKRKARQNGVEYLQGEVVSIQTTANRVDSVTLASGDVITAGKVVNATGPRGARTAAMAGIDLPIEPRRRYTFIFDAAEPLPRDLPLTIDPSGVHMRTDGQYYLCGCPPEVDPAVEFDDFYLDDSIWQDKLWPAIANRVPAFEAVKVMNSWVGHYAFNTLDQNAIIGPHDELDNFIFVNGFSGHGFQQSPAMGRGASELLTYGEFRSLDLSPLGFDRIRSMTPFVEKAVI